jgi:hypothetical protein
MYAHGRVAHSRARHVAGQCVCRVELVIGEAVTFAQGRMAGRMLLTALLTYLSPATGWLGVLQSPWVQPKLVEHVVPAEYVWSTRAWPRRGHAQGWPCGFASQLLAVLYEADSAGHLGVD